MNNKDFRVISEYLYGGGWQTALAKDLGVNIRTVQRWAVGELNISKGVENDIYWLAAAKQGNELMPFLKDIAEQHGLPEEIALKVNDGNSAHKRPWTFGSDFEIKKRIAEFLTKNGIKTIVEIGNI